MKLALDWLNEYVKLRRPAAELAERLSLTTAEVESVSEAPVPVQEAIVAKVTRVSPHPNADRLQLVTVNIGRAPQPTVVCGAPNVAVGQLVAYLPVKGHYYSERNKLVSLKSTSIRGRKSLGMLLSERELGLGEDHHQLMTLTTDCRPGTNLTTVLQWQKPVLELEITPNRGDLLSYLGLARELAALERERLNLPATKALASIQVEPTKALTTTVNAQAVERYATLQLDGLESVSSPAWLIYRLRHHGITSVHPAVDVANYVMLELGQPLHCFDAAKLAVKDQAPELIARTAKTGEQLHTLDGTRLKLQRGDLVISSQKKPVALAGIVGTPAAAVTASTASIVIEAAVFSPVAIRRTARRHNLLTEAAIRFEKGVDPNMTIVALKRAAELIISICGGRVVGRLCDISHPRAKTQLTLSLDRTHRLIGQEFDLVKTKQKLSTLGFHASANGRHGLNVIVPTWRPDVEREEDLIEEVIRAHGYERIVGTLPSGPLPTTGLRSPYQLERRLRTVLVRLGWQELVSQAFISYSQSQSWLWPTVDLVELANPTSVNEQYLRPCLSLGLLTHACQASRQSESLATFELGHTFLAGPKPTESSALALCLLTNNPTAGGRQLKAALSALAEVSEQGWLVSYVTCQSPASSFFSPATERIIINGQPAGELGLVSPKLSARHKVRGRRYILLAEIKLDSLYLTPERALQFKMPSRYPAVRRDINIDLPESTTAAAILQRITHSAPTELTALSVSDLFEKDKIRRLTVRLTFQSRRKTLKEKEVDQMVRLIKRRLND